jgi:lysophospholipase L1-like esterase
MCPHGCRPALMLFFAWSLPATAVAQESIKGRIPFESETSTPVPGTGRWLERYAQQNANLKAGNPQLLMIGDSIMQGWEGPGRHVWQKYYAPRQAVNLGIDRDRTQHVLWRLEHGNLDGIHPRLAVLLIGTNNASKNSPDQIAAGIKAIVDELRIRLPQTKILVLAIFPRGPNNEDPRRKVIAAANERIARLADGKHVFYVDINRKFLSADGSLSPAIMPDLLHPSAKGYEIWAQAMEPRVADLMAESRHSGR